jgi:hypothetical protein
MGRTEGGENLGGGRRTELENQVMEGYVRFKGIELEREEKRGREMRGRRRDGRR